MYMYGLNSEDPEVVLAAFQNLAGSRTGNIAVAELKAFVQKYFDEPGTGAQHKQQQASQQQHSSSTAQRHYALCGIASASADDCIDACLCIGLHFFSSSAVRHFDCC